MMHRATKIGFALRSLGYHIPNPLWLADLLAIKTDNHLTWLPGGGTYMSEMTVPYERGHVDITVTTQLVHGTPMVCYAFTAVASNGDNKVEDRQVFSTYASFDPENTNFPMTVGPGRPLRRSGLGYFNPHSMAGMSSQLAELV
jgi:hypothetical protein